MVVQRTTLNKRSKELLEKSRAMILFLQRDFFFREIRWTCLETAAESVVNAGNYRNYQNEFFCCFFGGINIIRSCRKGEINLDFIEIRTRLCRTTSVENTKSRSFYIEEYFSEKLRRFTEIRFSHCKN